MKIFTFKNFLKIAAFSVFIFAFNTKTMSQACPDAVTYDNGLNQFTFTYNTATPAGAIDHLVVTIDAGAGFGGGPYTLAVLTLAANSIVTGNSGTTLDATSHASLIDYQDNTNFSLATCGGSPLPVKLQAFTGSVIDGGILLNWKSASEHNAARYEVEQTNDGITWKSLGSVTAAGNMGSSYKYDVKAQITGAQTFFRLKQVDLDGTFEYSWVIPVRNPNFKKSADLNVFPNPTTGVINLEGVFSSVKILNNLGIMVMQSGNSNLLDTRSLQEGIYIMQFYDALGNPTSRVKLIRKM
jgi:hypothetical protein